MVGGNAAAALMRRVAAKDESGLAVPGEPAKVADVLGWLDYTAGDAGHLAYDAKTQETTHVFMCDYDQGIAELDDDGLSLACNGKTYEVLLIDDPVGLHEQLEIYLKRVG